MFLLITASAAVVSTIIWYIHAAQDTYKVSTLCFIYWGATIMWTVDRIMACFNGAAFFEMTLDAALLGITVVLCGLAAWLVIFVFKGPKGILKMILTGKK